MADIGYNCGSGQASRYSYRELLSKSFPFFSKKNKKISMQSYDKCVTFDEPSFSKSVIIDIRHFNKPEKDVYSCAGGSMHSSEDSFLHSRKNCSRHESFDVKTVCPIEHDHISCPIGNKSVGYLTLSTISEANIFQEAYSFDDAYDERNSLLETNKNVSTYTSNSDTRIEVYDSTLCNLDTSFESSSHSSSQNIFHGLLCMTTTTDRNINANRKKLDVHSKSKGRKKEKVMSKRSDDKVNKSDSERGRPKKHDAIQVSDSEDSKQGYNVKKGRNLGKTNLRSPSSNSGEEMSNEKSDRMDTEYENLVVVNYSKHIEEDGYRMSISSYPSSVYFIFGTELCERFTYFALRSILVMYLTTWVGMKASNATATFHWFSCLAYFFPIIGAFIADGFLDKYRTILCISIIYTIGCTILAFTAFPPAQIAGPLIGLFLISFGTGGIKPCVVTFGAEQFSKQSQEQRSTFFSTFYFVINIGSILSAVITPVIRSDIHCVGDACYPLAFGIPALLMLFALIVFACGHSSYVHKKPSGSTLCKAVSCVWYAIRSKESRKGEKYAHWLDKSVGVYRKSFVEDVKQVTKILWLFLPLPMFWALFNQQASRWTLQAAQLDGHVGFLGRIKPDQMQALNPIFIIILLPVFERFIYPLIDFCKISNRPLQRMVAGMLFCALAFCIAGSLGIALQSEMEVPLKRGESGYTIINGVDCNVNIHGDPQPFFEGNVPPLSKTKYYKVETTVKYITAYCSATALYTYATLNLSEQASYRVIIGPGSGKLQVIVADEKRVKGTNGAAYVSFLQLLPLNDVTKVRAYSLRDISKPAELNLNPMNATNFFAFEPGWYQVAFPPDPRNIASPHLLGFGSWQPVGHRFEVGPGGIYTVALFDPQLQNDLSNVLVETFQDLNPNTLSMMWMVPQYFVITVGEILFSATGLTFVYTQSPDSMKSVTQACWLLTTSIGDLIVFFVAKFNVASDQVSEFYLFSGLMVFSAIVFAIMCCFYEYNDVESGESAYHDQDDNMQRVSHKIGKEKISTIDTKHSADNIVEEKKRTEKIYQEKQVGKKKPGNDVGNKSESFHKSDEGRENSDTCDGGSEASSKADLDSLDRSSRESNGEKVSDSLSTGNNGKGKGHSDEDIRGGKAKQQKVNTDRVRFKARKVEKNVEKRATKDKARSKKKSPSGSSGSSKRGLKNVKQDGKKKPPLKRSNLKSNPSNGVGGNTSAGSNTSLNNKDQHSSSEGGSGTESEAGGKSGGGRKKFWKSHGRRS